MTKLTLNGKAITVDAAPDTPLLWVLRDHLTMTGTKFGCGASLCGACTVHLDGEPTRSCVTPVSAVAGRKVTTIEGLSGKVSAAVQRLRVNLALKVRHPVEPGQSPSEAWRSRVRARQIAVSSEHADFPALLAEALDRLKACDWDVSAAAAQLGVTTSQLIKFLQREPEACVLLNRQRAARQLRPLR